MVYHREVVLANNTSLIKVLSPVMCATVGKGMLWEDLDNSRTYDIPSVDNRLRSQEEGSKDGHGQEGLKGGVRWW